MRFRDIPGLADTKIQLVNAIKSGHIAHAQLFYGPEGSANLALALAYTTYLNCTNRTDGDACGVCPSCTKMAKYVHPDLQFVFPVSATKNISGKDVVSTSYLNDWRAFLSSNPYGTISDWSASYGAENKQANISKEESRNIIKNMTLTAFEAEYKVLIIWLPEFMHPSAANGILKILEEPPEKTIFLMVSCDYERLLTTILSRCQLFKVPAFQPEDVAGYLENNFQLEASKAQMISQLSEGSIAKALENLDDTESDAHALFRDWMRQCWTRDFIALHKTTDVFFKMSKNAQKLFLHYALNMMRHALIVDLLQDENQKLNVEEQAFVTKFGSALNSSKIEVISNELNKGYYHLERNANVRILFLDMSIVIGHAMTA